MPALLVSSTIKARLAISTKYPISFSKEELSNLRNREREERRNGADKAFVQAIYFFCQLKEFRKAADLLEEKYNGSVLYSVARIWYRLSNMEEEDKNKLESDIDDLYEERDKVTPKIQLFMAKHTIKSMNKKFEESLDTLNEGIVFYPTFIPFMVEKYLCLMSLGEWDEYHQAALEVSQRDRNNI